MRFRIALVMLPLITSLCLAASPQKPAKTKYLLSAIAGFTMTEKDGAVYSMAYEVREKLPAQVFVVALFDNPEAPRTPLRKEFEVPADATRIQVESPGIYVIRNDVLYKVSLSLYLDPGHTKLLTRHDQKVLFKMGKEIHGFLQQRYGLTVQ